MEQPRVEQLFKAQEIGVMSEQGAPSKILETGQPIGIVNKVYALSQTTDSSVGNQEYKMCKSTSTMNRVTHTKL